MGVTVSLTDSTLVVRQRGESTVSVSAWLDEPYSTRNLSDYGDYKKQVVDQWKRDFPHNEDVEKGKWMMAHYFEDFYADAFEVLLEGNYRVVERTDSTMTVKNLSLDIPLMMWKRAKEPKSATAPGSAIRPFLKRVPWAGCMCRLRLWRSA